MKSFRSNLFATLQRLVLWTLPVTVLAGCQPYAIDVDGNQPPPEVNLDDAEIVDQSPLESSPRANGGAIETAASRIAEENAAGDFAPNDEITIRGAVLGKRHVKLDDGHTGVVVKLQPGGDFVDVLIGTTRFNEAHDVNVGIADRVMVTGPVVRMESMESGRLMLARELVWNNRTIELRDEEGKPHWE